MSIPNSCKKKVELSQLLYDYALPMTADITPQELKAWRKAERLTQPELGEMIGIDKYAITTIENSRRKISEPEQRLLKLLIRGEAPFETNKAPWDPSIEFSESEWSMMHRIAIREGYHSARPWIVAKIRGYIAMTEATNTELKVAEDQSPFGKKPNGDVGKSG